MRVPSIKFATCVGASRRKRIAGDLVMTVASIAIYD